MGAEISLRFFADGEKDLGADERAALARRLSYNCWTRK